MNAQTPTEFGPPLIGQTEKALNAILGRELDGSGLSEPGWVLLKLAAGAGGTLGRDALVERAAVVSKFPAQQVGGEIEALVEAGYLEGAGAGGDVALTAAARDLQARIGSRVTEVTTRLWGDLADADLATAGRVLGTVLSRANAELGYSI